MVNVSGTLLTNHTTPPGLEGLYTIPKVEHSGNFSPPTNKSLGWDRKVIIGNCFLMDVNFLFEPLVQRFLELVLSSNYHIRFRWNEQAVFWNALAAICA